MSFSCCFTPITSSIGNKTDSTHHLERGKILDLPICYVVNSHINAQSEQWVGEWLGVD